jgi:hypothetical protein
MPGVIIGDPTCTCPPSAVDINQDWVSEVSRESTGECDVIGQPPAVDPVEEIRADMAAFCRPTGEAMETLLSALDKANAEIAELKNEVDSYVQPLKDERARNLMEAYDKLRAELEAVKVEHDRYRNVLTEFVHEGQMYCDIEALRNIARAALEHWRV